MSIKRLLAVLGIALGILALAMLWSTVNMALSAIQKDLDASILQLQWGVNAYGIFMCVPLVMVGKLADGYGRKPFFILGLALALVSSFVGGFAQYVWHWIVSMSIFGVAGSIILPLSQALLVHQFPENRKEFAVGLWSTFVSISLTIGPMVGGSLIYFWGWRWIYYINIVPMLLAILWVAIFVEKETELHKPKCDWSGIGLLAVFVASLVIAIMQGQSWGWSSPSIIGLFVLSFITLMVFIFFERRSPRPLFRPDLFLQRSFLCSAIPNGCTIGFIWVAFFLIPLYLQSVRGYSSFETGLVLLFITVPVALLSHTVSNWYVKVGARPLMLIGFSLFGVAAILHAFFANAHFSYLAFACLFIGLGWAFVWGPSISVALTSLSHQLAGIASGMFLTLQELGGVLTLSVGGAIYRVTNYQITFWFLLAVSLYAFLVTLFLPKKS